MHTLKDAATPTFTRTRACTHTHTSSLCLQNARMHLIMYNLLLKEKLHNSTHKLLNTIKGMRTVYTMYTNIKRKAWQSTTILTRESHNSGSPGLVQPHWLQHVCNGFFLRSAGMLGGGPAIQELPQQRDSNFRCTPQHWTMIIFTPITYIHRAQQPSPYHRKRLSSFFVGCLTSKQHASVSQGQICSDNFTCWHTEIEVADQTFHLTKSPLTLGQPVPALTLLRQAPGRVATGVLIFKSLVWLQEKSQHKRDSNPGSSALEVDAETTRPTRQCKEEAFKKLKTTVN